MSSVVYFYFLKIFLLFLLMVAPVDSGACTTAGCKTAALKILNLINLSVDPCKDFYKFACTEIFNKTDENKVSLEAMVRKEVDDQITMMLIKPTEQGDVKAVQGLKKFFKACVDEAAIERHGFDTVKRALSYLGGWPAVDGRGWYEDQFSLEEVLVKLRRIGYNFKQLFNLRMDAGQESNILMITQPTVEFISEKDRGSYREYMIDTAVHLGANRSVAERDVEETLQFKAKLLELSEIQEQFDKTTVESLQERYPILSWERFINNILHPSGKVYEHDNVFVPATKYLKNLQGLLAETSGRTVANYIIWEALDSIIPYLPKTFRNFKRQYVYSTSNNILVGEDSWSRLAFCKSRTRQILRPTFEALYVKEYFSDERRGAAETVVSAVRREFINLLNETDLYDDGTKEKILEKATSIRYRIGAPKSVYDEELLLEMFDEEQGVSTTDFLTIASILNRQSVNFSFKFGTRSDFYNTFYEETLLPKAFYSTFYNSMVVPAASLQEPYFNHDRPQYLNFGTIGTVIGYELSHGFTLEGASYEPQLWTNGSIERYRSRAECFVAQANNFTVENSDSHMDGDRILDETVCDHTGVEVAYRAYERWIEENGAEKQLPGLTYTPKQLFWITAASLFCDTVPVDRMKDFLKNDNSGVPAFRAFAALSNSENFGRDFNCPGGAPMHPVEKCQLY